ncbi:MAG: hypothetical protein PGN13_02245 [Patulibacter minatonensis]
MTDWIAIEATEDRRRRALDLARAHDRMAGGGAAQRRRSTDVPVREVIQRSWQRSTAAGLDPGHGLAPVAHAEDEVARRWAEHPLSIAVPILRGLLDDVGDSDHVALVCDADGALLWLDGRPALVERAKEVHLQLGSVWSEQEAGTNAMGTALAEHHAVQVFSAEHFTAPVHGWTCSAAPVHDPTSGALLGVIDLTGELATAHPHSLAVVNLAAKTIEHQLAVRAQADPGAGAVPALTLTVLGRDRAVAHIGGRRLELSRRHTEMLLLLWLAPEGLTAEQLALEVYGERGRPGTVRTEMHRLRAQLGATIGERPYRLAAPIGCDLHDVDERIRRGDLRGALARYPGPALAQTEVPRLVELRDRIDDALRAAVLATGDPSLLELWLRTPTGRDDYEASRALMVGLSREDPRRAGERSRLRRLSEQRRAG